jgi:hypothetical protein
MKLIISERINKSKIKPEWDTYYWLLYVTEKNKKVYYKHWNKMFDMEPFLKTLIKTYSITEVRCIHSTPECVHALFNGISNI